MKQDRLTTFFGISPPTALKVREVSSLVYDSSLSSFISEKYPEFISLPIDSLENKAQTICSIIANLIRPEVDNATGHDVVSGFYCLFIVDAPKQ